MLRSHYILALVVLVASSCGQHEASDSTAGTTKDTHMNPFTAPSTLPFHAPAFDKIKTSDFQPAMEEGMALQLKEVEAIASSTRACDF